MRRNGIKNWLLRARLKAKCQEGYRMKYMKILGTCLSNNITVLQLIKASEDRYLQILGKTWSLSLSSSRHGIDGTLRRRRSHTFVLILSQHSLVHAFLLQMNESKESWGQATFTTEQAQASQVLLIVWRYSVDGADNRQVSTRYQSIQTAHGTMHTTQCRSVSAAAEAAAAADMTSYWRYISEQASSHVYVVVVIALKPTQRRMHHEARWRRPRRC